MRVEIEMQQVVDRLLMITWPQGLSSLAWILWSISFAGNHKNLG
jgi:hypothetical protein